MPFETILEFLASVDRYPWSFVFYYTSSKSMHKELTKNPLASISLTYEYLRLIHKLPPSYSLSTTTVQSCRKHPPSPILPTYLTHLVQEILLSSPQRKSQYVAIPIFASLSSASVKIPFLIVNARSPAIRAPSNPAPRTARSRTRGSRPRCTE